MMSIVNNWLLSGPSGDVNRIVKHVTGLLHLQIRRAITRKAVRGGALGG